MRTIVQPVSFTAFATAFEQAGRDDQFTGSALMAIYDDLVSQASDLDHDIQLDIPAICIAYSQLSWQEAARIIGRPNWTDQSPSRARRHTIESKLLDLGVRIIAADSDTITFCGSL